MARYSAGPVDILLNGEPRAIDAHETIASLLSSLGLAASMVAVEVNLEIVPRARYAERALTPGAQVEIVTFVGGG